MCHILCAICSCPNVKMLRQRNRIEEKQFIGYLQQNIKLKETKKEIQVSMVELAGNVFISTS